MGTAILPAISRRRPYVYPDEYLPESEGRPMAETDRHRKLMIGLLHALAEHFLQK